MAVKEKKIKRAATSAMLREGWRRVKFGDVARNVDVAERNPLENGLERYVGLEHFDPESLQIKRWGLIEEGTSFTRKFAKGQVLFVKRRAYQRKAAVVEFDGICSGDILVFEPKGHDLIPELLPFIVQSDGFFEKALGTSAGSLSPRTKWKDLSAYEFALPPKDEQRRIADILWAAENDYQCFLNVIESLKQFRRALIKQIFGPVLQDSVLNGWEQRRLGDLFMSRKETGFPLLQILSVTIDGRVVTRESLGRQVIDKTGPDKYLRVLPGDIMYNTMRMWQGSSGLVETEGIISPAYTVLVPKGENVNSQYFSYLFRTDSMMDLFRRFSVGVASDRWRLYYRDFSKININVPSRSEQDRAVNTISSVDNVLKDSVNRVNTSNVLKNRLNSSLFADH